jgi:hypothetical protein
MTHVCVSIMNVSPYISSTLNPFAAPYVPTDPMEPMERAQKVSKTPFFAQRFERFLHTVRDHVGTVADLQILLMNPAIPPTTKKVTQFLAIYKQKMVVYEADRLDDPRTGSFRFL